jgi:hypothetical protein
MSFITKLLPRYNHSLSPSGKFVFLFVFPHFHSQFPFKKIDISPRNQPSFHFKNWDFFGLGIFELPNILQEHLGLAIEVREETKGLKDGHHETKDCTICGEFFTFFYAAAHTKKVESVSEESTDGSHSNPKTPSIGNSDSAHQLCRNGLQYFFAAGGEVADGESSTYANFDDIHDFLFSPFNTV